MQRVQGSGISKVEMTWQAVPENRQRVPLVGVHLQMGRWFTCGGGLLQAHIEGVHKAVYKAGTVPRTVHATHAAITPKLQCRGE